VVDAGIDLGRLSVQKIWRMRERGVVAHRAAAGVDTVCSIVRRGRYGFRAGRGQGAVGKHHGNAEFARQRVA
jgi:hypothetical protein